MKIPLAREDCLECGTKFKPEEQEQKFCSTDCQDDYDPTPWCSGCGSMTRKGCGCGPIADND